MQDDKSFDWGGMLGDIAGTAIDHIFGSGPAQPTAPPPPPPAKSGNTLLYVGLGAVVLIAALVLIFKK